MTLLAILRPPPKSPGKRSARPPTDLAAATALVLGDEGARALHSSPDRVEIAVETSTGHHLELTLRPGEIRVQAALPGPGRMRDEEHGGWIETDEDRDIEEAASRLVERIQQATGWHVESKELPGFEPIGPCRSCGVECFEWQDRCPLCDAPIGDDEDDEDDEDEPAEDAATRRARRLVEALLEHELLELCSSHGVAVVESTVAAALANGRGEPAEVLDLLTGLREVAEVYADEDQIAQWLR